MMETRALRKLVNTVEAAGGWFAKRDERPYLMDVDLPESLSQHESTIRENYDAILGMLFPQARSSRKKRFTCAICKSGAGCRRRQAIKDYQNCPTCTHWCISHFLPEAHSSGGCLKWVGPDFAMTRCKCPGWPVAPEPVKTRKKATQENVMPLFSTEELQESHERYLQKQTQDTERPRSKAEILVELVRNDPTLTVNELSEGSGHSKSWVRRHLKVAGLKAAPARRQRTLEPGEESQ
jgi:hypothetical protein